MTKSFDDSQCQLLHLEGKLEAVRDDNGKPVIRKVYRSDKFYAGPLAKQAPDLIIGYHRGYRCAWNSATGGLDEPVLMDNTQVWCADHCFDPEQIPGVLFSNRPIVAKNPSLVDLAPTILAEFGLSRPDSMTGKNIF